VHVLENVFSKCRNAESNTRIFVICKEAMTPRDIPGNVIVKRLVKKELNKYGKTDTGKDQPTLNA
jgi:hypothetical protein